MFFSHLTLAGQMLHNPVKMILKPVDYSRGFSLKLHNYLWGNIEHLIQYILIKITLHLVSGGLSTKRDVPTNFTILYIFFLETYITHYWVQRQSNIIIVIKLKPT